LQINSVHNLIVLLKLLHRQCRANFHSTIIPTNLRRSPAETMGWLAKRLTPRYYHGADLMRFVEQRLVSQRRRRVDVVEDSFFFLFST
jgi:hypothetical protein